MLQRTLHRLTAYLPCHCSLPAKMTFLNLSSASVVSPLTSPHLTKYCTGLGVSVCKRLHTVNNAFHLKTKPTKVFRLTDFSFASNTPQKVEPIFSLVSLAPQTFFRQNYSFFAKSSLFVGFGSSEDVPQAPVEIDLDLDSMLSAGNVGSLRHNLLARNMELDLDQLVDDHRRWSELDLVKRRLEGERSQTARQMAALLKDKATSGDKAKEKEELIKKGKEVKEKLRELMPVWGQREEQVVLQALKLPADIHPQTPDEDQILDACEGRIETAGSSASHIETAEQQGLLKFSNVGPRAAYLMGELAELEQSLLHYGAARMRQAGFEPIACPEAFRSVVVEGCGHEMSKEDIFTLYQKENSSQPFDAYHLKGNSLLSYAAFFTKMQVKREHLPVKMYSVGRHYTPQPGIKLDLPGLYGLVQSNRVTMFCGCDSGEGATEVYQHMLETAWDIVKSLGLPARKRLVSVRDLAQSEGLRAEVELWAPSLDQYVTVAHASIHGDYVSRRLMSRVGPEGQPLHMVSGVALDTSVALASILEHSVSQGHIQLKPIPGVNS